MLLDVMVAQVADVVSHFLFENEKYLDRGRVPIGLYVGKEMAQNAKKLPISSPSFLNIARHLCILCVLLCMG